MLQQIFSLAALEKRWSKVVGMPKLLVAFHENRWNTLRTSKMDGTVASMDGDNVHYNADGGGVPFGYYRSPSGLDFLLNDCRVSFVFC
jgi:hypothetical protein